MERAIREATVEDALSIARIHVRSWQAAYRGIVDDDYCWTIDDALVYIQDFTCPDPRCGVIDDARACEVRRPRRLRKSSSGPILIQRI